VHQPLILVIAADLTWNKGVPALGSESRRVCETAAKLAADMSDARIYCTAGTAVNFKSVQMSQLMKEYLISCGTARARTQACCAKTFTTVGEARRFWQSILKQWRAEESPRYNVFVVARFWHAPRAERVMWSTLPSAMKRHVTIQVVLAPSDDWRFERRKEWLRWLKGTWHIVFGSIRMKLLKSK